MKIEGREVSMNPNPLSPDRNTRWGAYGWLRERVEADRGFDLFVYYNHPDYYNAHQCPEDLFLMARQWLKEIGRIK